jgi:Sigma-70, region 4
VVQFTQREIALLMGLSERAVREIEKRALRKLRQHPAMRGLWREWIGEGATSTADLKLTDAEVAAGYGLAWTRAERWAMDKMMELATPAAAGTPIAEVSSAVDW